MRPVSDRFEGSLGRNRRYRRNVRDTLLNEIAHDERKRRDITLGVALDDRYRRIGEDPRVGECAKKSVAGFIQCRRGGNLRKADDSFRLVLCRRARGNDCEREERRQPKVSCDRAANMCSVSVDLPRQRDTTLGATRRLCQA
jgi:hypothetical protein